MPVTRAGPVARAIRPEGVAVIPPSSSSSRGPGNSWSSNNSYTRYLKLIITTRRNRPQCSFRAGTQVSRRISSHRPSSHLKMTRFKMRRRRWWPTVDQFRNGGALRKQRQLTVHVLHVDDVVNANSLESRCSCKLAPKSDTFGPFPPNS